MKIYTDISLMYSYANVGSVKEITIKDLTLIIKDIMNYDEEINFNPYKPDGSTRKLLNYNRLNILPLYQKQF